MVIRKQYLVTCFDFATVYNYILHSKLISILNEHIGVGFKGSYEKFIVVDRYGGLVE